MDLPEILMILLISFLLFTVFYRTYYHFVYRQKVNYARPLSISKRALNVLSLFFGFCIVGLGAYLFMFPAKAQDIGVQNKSEYLWSDFRKPFEVVFDRPINKNSIQYSFSNNLKGTWKFEKLNSYDVFYRKLVFYPEETLLPKQKVLFTAKYTSVFGISERELSVAITAGTDKPEVKLNEAIEDKQNVNPTEEIQAYVQNVDPKSYLVTMSSDPKGIFETDTPGNYKSHLPFKNGQQYEVKVFLTPVSYNLETGRVLQLGEKVEAKTFRFQTAPTPSIKDVVPKGENVLSSERIQISFDSEMDRESVEKNFVIEPKVDGKFEWDNESTKVGFIPSSSLQKETKYKLSLGADAKSKYGAKIGQSNAGKGFYPEYTHQFTTIGSVGIASTSPTSGSFDVKTNTPITIKFNQEVDRPSAESKITISPPTEGKFAWDGNTITFTPTGRLKYAKNYSITVQAGIKSKDGLDLKSSYSFSFTTQTNTVLLQVPIANQPSQFACNVTAASIVLKYRGINIDPMSIYNQLPKETAPQTAETWGNPNLGYVGNIFGVWGGDRTAGYGVHWDPIRNFIAKYRPAEVKRNWNVTELLNEVDNGNLSIVWWQNGTATPYRLSWTAKDANGKPTTITAVNGMHSEVVIGYVGSPENPTQIILSDPWASRWNNKYHYVTLSEFNNLWQYYGNTAVLVR